MGNSPFEMLCYTYDGWEPRIRPASSKRDWMEASPERFAYRCLPLAIANAHGWELLSSCGFQARWNGGPNPDDVEIILDDDARAKQPPVALFGQGTFTFHVEGLFRTPKGWNLWVGGSPNAGKDGIAPLAGVIETDWAPYSFTMNWRFTRPNHWIRFEENEPFCFMFPIERERIEGIVPKILPISDNPELKTQYELWSQSRDAFQDWVRKENPSAPTDKWQKLYYRGRMPDGSAGPDDHRTKLRLCPFHSADGKPVATGEMSARSPNTERLAHDEASSVQVNALTRSLQLSTWRMMIAEDQQALTYGAEPVPRVENLSSKEFLERHYAPSRPAILNKVAKSWPAIALWTPAYLREKLADAPVEYQGERNASAEFELYKDEFKRTAAFREFMDSITAPDAGNDAYLTAYNSSTNQTTLAPLLDDIRPLTEYLTGSPGMMWIGPRGTFTPLHFDLTNNLLVQVVGTKTLVLVPPSDSALLYNRVHVFSDVHDIQDSQCLDRFPLARHARTLAVRLEPGDALYIPVGWWHQVRAEHFSVSITYTDFLWPNDSYESFPAT